MCQLDDPAIIAQRDPNRMIDLVTGFPRQCQAALEIGQRFARPRIRPPTALLITGMGGSAIGGDLIKAYLQSRVTYPILVNRNYTLPLYLDEQALVVVSSYSGNTEETLAAYQAARSRATQILCITSNGELKRQAEADSIPCITIPSGLPPRAALGYSFIPILITLAQSGCAPPVDQDLDELIRMATLLAEEYGPSQARENNRAKQLAAELAGRLPILYAAEQNWVVSVRWHGQLAENSKMLSHHNVFPELNHNEIVGWEIPADLLRRCSIVLLRDRDDHPRIQKRMALTGQILGPLAGALCELWSRGEGRLARLFSLLYLGDFVSVYLAILNGVDPTPVAKIDRLKRQMTAPKTT